MKRVHRITDLPDYLREEIQTLDGMRSNLLCPSCNGGRSHEHSLSMWPGTGRVTLKCWRNGCGYWATIPLDPNIKIEPARFQPRVFMGKTMALEGSPSLWFEHRFGVRPATASAFRVKQIIGKKALYNPVFGPDGGERGGVARYYDGSTPKAITYKHTDEPWLAWYTADEPVGFVIVEDQVSALRCWQLGYTVVALLGTAISKDKANEILLAPAFADERLLLALDKDAWAKACAYAKKWPAMKPVMLGADLKDCTDDEIMEVLGG